MFAAAFAAYALIRHIHFATGLDLGIFDQAVWHYSRFETPETTVNGLPNLLGDHFHPILILLAPLYWIWSDARVLLIVQALLVAGSMVPVFLFARPRLGRTGALLLAVAYVSFWGLLRGVGFDFHEVAFAPLLIALVIWAIDARRWKTYALVVVLLLMVKEDLSIFVAFVGIYLLALREPRAGAVTIIAGVAWYALTTKVVIPHFSASGQFNYWTFTTLGKDLPDALLSIAAHPWRPFHIALGNEEKVRTLLYLFLPFLGLTLCSRIAILAVPLLAERFVSTNPQFWGTHFHYSMAIAPVLAMGAAAGLHNVSHMIGHRYARTVATAGAGVVLLVSVLASVVIVRPDAVVEPTKRAFYSDPPNAASLRRALARIPPRASVTALGPALPHLAHRRELRELDPRFGLTTYLLTNVVGQVGSVGAHRSYRDQQADVFTRLVHYYPVYYDTGWVLFRRRPAGPAGRHPRDLALTPMTKLQFQRLATDYAFWERARAHALAAFERCVSLRTRGDPSAAGCFAAAGADFRVRQRTALAALVNVTPTLLGGCRELAQLSIEGTTTAAKNLELVRAAGASDTRTQLMRAGARVYNDAEHLDLPGRFRRFLLLCQPA